MLMLVREEHWENIRTPIVVPWMLTDVTCSKGGHHPQSEGQLVAHARYSRSRDERETRVATRLRPHIDTLEGLVANRVDVCRDGQRAPKI